MLDAESPIESRRPRLWPGALLAPLISGPGSVLLISLTVAEPGDSIADDPSGLWFVAVIATVVAALGTWLVGVPLAWLLRRSHRLYGAWLCLLSVLVGTVYWLVLLEWAARPRGAPGTETFLMGAGFSLLTALVFCLINRIPWWPAAAKDA